MIAQMCSILTLLQRDVLAGDNERQADLLQDLQFQIKDLVEVEAQASVENAAIQKQSTHALQRMRSKFVPVVDFSTSVLTIFFLQP
jgi:Zn-dependent membrane protease YugP